MLRDATQRALWDILESEQILYRYHKSSNTVLLPDAPFYGSEIIFRSLDDPERLRGTNLAWFGIDELTYAKPEGWTRLQGRLRHPRARRLEGFAAWTPKGFDWVYEKFIADPPPDYKAYLASPRENRHVEATGMYDALAAGYDERLYRQEVLGEYLNIASDRCYYAFDSLQSIRPVTYNPDLPLCWTLDFNVNPMSSLLCQRHGDRLLVLDELVLPNSNTLKACEAFLERTRGMRDGLPQRPSGIWPPGYGPPPTYGKLSVYVYGDATGSGRRSAASRTDWQIVREFFGRHSDQFAASLRVPSQNPHVKDRVNCVNALLCNHLGERRLLVHPQCKELRKDLEQVGWKSDPNGRILYDIDDSDPARTHTSSALGYLVSREFPLRVKAGEKRTRIV